MSAPNSKPAATAVPAKRLSKLEEFGVALRKHESDYNRMLPEHLRGNQFVESWRAYAMARPEILTWNLASTALAVRMAAQLGLMPHGAIPGVHLLGFKNKRTGMVDCTLVCDYRALIDLAVRGGGIRDIHVQHVFRDDKFSYSGGLHPDIKHEWDLDKGDTQRGEFRGCYAVLTLLDGSRKPTWCNKAMIEQRRARSRAKDDGPWITDYLAMAAKTTIRIALNTVPKSARSLVALATALELEDRVDRGHASTEQYVGGEYIDVETTPVVPQEVVDPPADESSADPPAPTEPEPQVAPGKPALSPEQVERAAGAKAAAEGVSHKLNPHPAGDPRRVWWQAGWAASPPQTAAPGPAPEPGSAG